MKAYIQSKSTHLFYGGWGQWCADYRHALSFEALRPAIDRLTLDQILDSEVILIEQGGVQIIFSVGSMTAPLPLVG